MKYLIFIGAKGNMFAVGFLSKYIKHLIKYFVGIHKSKTFSEIWKSTLVFCYKTRTFIKVIFKYVYINIVCTMVRVYSVTFIYTIYGVGVGPVEWCASLLISGPWCEWILPNVGLRLLTVRCGTASRTDCELMQYHIPISAFGLKHFF